MFELNSEFSKKMFNDNKWSILNGLRRELEKEARAIVDYSGSFSDTEFSLLVDRLDTALDLIDKFNDMVSLNK